MAPDGRLLQPGDTGEIVIRGPNVTAGYENNSDANATAFAHGWFHTGDQALLDEDFYLRVTGRLKEIINRGGEKISPLEVDDVPMDHPAVAQVVTFAMPHDKLGRSRGCDRAARGMAATEADIRSFAATRLADFKVPRIVLILDEIPKGATGKLQRIGLAAIGPANPLGRAGIMRISIFGAGAIGGYVAANLPWPAASICRSWRAARISTRSGQWASPDRRRS